MTKTVLFVDDRRVPPFPHFLVTSVEAAVRWLSNPDTPQPDELWLDYDLGVDEFGIQQTMWPLIEELIAGRQTWVDRIPKVVVHTGDARAARRMLKALRQAGFTAVENPLP